LTNNDHYQKLWKAGIKLNAVIAERKLYAVSGDGKPSELWLRIGTPYRISEDEWACPVALDGFHKQPVDMHGVDSWQALQLAQQLLARLLGGLIEEGGRLYWEEGGAPIALSELFASTLPPNGLL